MHVKPQCVNPGKDLDTREKTSNQKLAIVVFLCTRSLHEPIWKADGFHEGSFKLPHQANLLTARAPQGAARLGYVSVTPRVTLRTRGKPSTNVSAGSARRTCEGHGSLWRIIVWCEANSFAVKIHNLLRQTKTLLSHLGPARISASWAHCAL